MRSGNIFPCLVLAACLLTGITSGQDYLSGGYVSSFDRSSMMDPGIAGMVRWLDAPVPNFPWYSSSDVGFIRQAVPATTFSPYSEYYSTAAASFASGIISGPVRFDVAQGMPTSVYYGAGQGLPYSQYLSIMPTRTNDLWIRGAENWTQYLVCPVGTTMQLVANAPAGGAGGFYETVQTETVSTNYKTYRFYQGYNSMTYRAGQIGRHMLYFVIGNQPSNVVIVDVFAQGQLAQTSAVPLSGSAGTQQTPAVAAAASGDTPVTINYPGPGSYQVYVDGAYVGSSAGGSYTFKVKGGMSHLIRVWDGFWPYEREVFVESGVPKIIYVEAV